MHKPKLQILSNMGTKRTIANHKPYVICNQTTLNTVAMLTIMLLHKKKITNKFKLV